MAIYQSILDTIGRTPVVRLNRMAPAGIEIFVKLEAFNPMGSVKDRMARAMIEAAERSGELRPGQTVIEATSGNTGIALAMVCAERGYPLVIVMAENFSVERRRLMRFLGARVVLTPAADKGSGMLAKAEELARAHGWYLCRQFDNPANARAHRETTAREIIEDFAGRRLDYWVAGAGTGGTFAGVAGVLREQRPDTRIVVCEPDNSPMIAGGVAQPVDADGRPGSHPHFRPHLMQGWSPDFIASITRAAMAEHLAHRIQPVNGNAALEAARTLARSEGILTGITGGATVAGALALAREAPPGTTFLCMLPDTGERYLSTPLFADVPADMSGDERAISASTPSCRFSTEAAAPVGSAATCPISTATCAAPRGHAGPRDRTVYAQSSGDPAMLSIVRSLIDDRSRPALMFALEWCEFCWSVRRLFEHLGVPLRVIELDSVACRAADRGSRIRAVLREMFGSPTIPQVFVGGSHLGGCTEVMAAFRHGDLHRRLRALGMVPAPCEQLDPATLLPAWLQAR